MERRSQSAEVLQQSRYFSKLGKTFLSTSSSIPSTTFPLAPSPRILAYLARKGRLNMAIMAIEQQQPWANQVEPAEEFKPPPKVVTPPCDPWPRPYYLEDGLRRVAPYHFTYNTWCKERWRGKEILEIFATEFRDRTKEYYVRALKSWDLDFFQLIFL
jgi:tRNA pseudouridine synthase 9